MRLEFALRERSDRCSGVIRCVPALVAAAISSREYFSSFASAPFLALSDRSSGVLLAKLAALAFLAAVLRAVAGIS